MDNRQRVRRPARIRVEGPLAPFTDGMREGLSCVKDLGQFLGLLIMQRVLRPGVR